MISGCTPWPDEYAKIYRDKGYWEDKTLAETLESCISKFSANEALIFNDIRLTYSQLGEKINRLAYHFIQSGLKPQDRVVIQLPNIPEFVYVYFALVKIGVIPLMALPPHRHTEITHFFKYSGAVAYFIPDNFRKFDYRTMAQEISAQHENLKFVFVAGEPSNNQIGLTNLLNTVPEVNSLEEFLAPYRPDPSEVALMLLSGGTTALPKLIPRTHNDYVYNAKQSGAVAGIDEKTILLAVLPMAHNYTLASPGLQAVLFNGGKVVISPGVDNDSVFSLVAKEKVTLIPAAVPLVSNWVNSDIPSKYDISSLEVVQNGGARLAPELRKKLIEKFNCIPQEVFGTAEGLLNLTKLDDDEETMLNSSGKPCSPGDEVKIIDENGLELPVGSVGELVVRGPYTIRGYYNNPEVNKNSFTEDGFYRMGDVCRINEQGYIFAEGRKKDLINRGGEKISCEEIENFIFAHPKVKAVCIVAMPDEVFGEKACAFVISKPGESLTFGELTEFLLEQNIAKFKLPERLEVVDSFPLSPAGKILKRNLREIITEKLAREKSQLPLPGQVRIY